MTPDESRFFGIDFSGGRDAGRKIWIADAHLVNGRLRITSCRQAEMLPGSGRAPELCLPALRTLIERTMPRPAVVGCDFPFSLPAVLLEDYACWEVFAAGFNARFADAGAVRSYCVVAANGRELRRPTERESHTPFCAYNLRLYRQTFAGIGGVLAPLLAGGTVRLVPFQHPQPGLPSLIEVCPASTLKRLGLYRPYKGRGEAARAQRRAIAESLCSSIVMPPAVLLQILDDKEGDALDSVIAALAAARAVPALTETATGDREGRVYY